VVKDTTGSNKRYYWLKLKDDFFRQKEIKQLRKIAGGDSFTIIYLKMLLRSLKDDGKLYYEGVDDDFVSELALDIDEDVENVKMTVAFLMAKGLLVQSQTDEYTLSAAESLTGSEGYSAERMRRLRSKALLASHSDTSVTACDEEIEKEIEKRDRDRDRVTRKRFTPPTIEQVSAYASEMGWTESQFMPERFVDFYESKGWKVGKDTMKSWKAAARGWVSRQKQPATVHNKPNPALDYSQRKYTDADFGDDFFVDLSKYGGGNNA
jgi:predicted phage replisome organizer